jgi:ribosomal protein S17
MITLENESYTVEKFMMVTAKLVGNIIACDDKKSVSLVDPKTMQQLASI